MRLINTLTLELEEFMGATPPYAILSHTWAEGEVTLQDWQKVRQGERWRTTGLVNGTAKPTTKNGGIASLYRQQQQQQQHRQHQQHQQLPIYYTPPTDHSTFEDALGAFNAVEPRAGYWKILKACFQARADGLAHAWVDTNCIDKTSSAELSEAINSMYAWYRDAAVCYVYLVDVPLSPQQDTLRAPGSRFRTSRWFTRGWTLQELIAPPDAVFFSGEWTRLGTKISLSGLLADITHIGEKYLLKMEGIDGASIAQRMSWASNRTTTRPEDIAYCLLGLFSVHMPLIYGEGAKAFARLQEEIIKISDDHSIFAWTWIPQLTDPLMRGKRVGGAVPAPPSSPSSPRHYRESSSSSMAGREGDGSPRFPHARLRALRDRGTRSNPERPTMLAPDPLAFYDSGHFRALAPRPDVSPFAITNAGLSISLPLLPQGSGDGQLLFAVLHCEVGRKRGEQVLVCVPLAKHGRLTHRYTRTCFPRGPVTIRRRGFDDVAAAAASHLQQVLLSPRAIQVARDVQRVPFYYGAFGGTHHECGFWFFTPRGWAGYDIDGGFVSHNGVFNSHGIFFDRHAAADSVGGVVVLRNQRREVALYLAHGPGAGDWPPPMRVRVLVRVSLLRSTAGGGPAEEVSIRGNTWTGGGLDGSGYEKLFEALRREDEETDRGGDGGDGGGGGGVGVGRLEDVVEASAGSVRAVLQNQAALSNAPRSSITIAEISFVQDRLLEREPPAAGRKMGLFRGARTI